MLTCSISYYWSEPWINKAPVANNFSKCLRLKGNSFDINFTKLIFWSPYSNLSISTEFTANKCIYRLQSPEYRACHFPLPDGLGQVKLQVGQVDLNRFFLFISYKQIEELQNSWSRASDDFEKRQALEYHTDGIVQDYSISNVLVIRIPQDCAQLIPT